LVIQRMCLHGIEIPVGKVEPPGGVLGQVRLLDIRVGLLGMKKDFHLLLHQSLLRAYEQITDTAWPRSCSLARAVQGSPTLPCATAACLPPRWPSPLAWPPAWGTTGRGCRSVDGISKQTIARGDTGGKMCFILQMPPAVA